MKKNSQYQCTLSSWPPCSSRPPGQLHPSVFLSQPPGHGEPSPPSDVSDARSPTRPDRGQALPLGCSLQKTTFSQFQTRKRSRYDPEKKTEQKERERKGIRTRQRPTSKERTSEKVTWSFSPKEVAKAPQVAVSSDNR